MEWDFLQMFGLTTEKLMFIIVVVLALFVLLCFILCMINMSKLQHIVRDETDIPSIDELKKYLKKMKQLSDNVENISANLGKSPGGTASAENKAADIPSTQVQQKAAASDDNAITKFSVVHFNAFPGVTGSISFSLAMLNNKNNGIILTSLYGHDSCNTYIREINDGKSEIYLLKEETAALEAAINGGNNQNGSKQE